MGPRKIAIILSLIPLLSSAANSKWTGIAIGTNIVDNIYLCTFNVDIGKALGRHWSTHIGGEYNPFSWENEAVRFQDKRLTLSAEIRYWPWYTFSGWYIGGGTAYRRYNKGGFSSPETEEGDAVGGTIEGGYALMINRRTNIEFGLGIWGGYKKYKTYEKPQCGKLINQGSKFFIRPDEINISLVFTF